MILMRWLACEIDMGLSKPRTGRIERQAGIAYDEPPYMELSFNPPRAGGVRLGRRSHQSGNGLIRKVRRGRAMGRSKPGRVKRRVIIIVRRPPEKHVPGLADSRPCLGRGIEDSVPADSERRYTPFMGLQHAQIISPSGLRPPRPRRWYELSLPRCSLRRVSISAEFRSCRWWLEENT